MTTLADLLDAAGLTIVQWRALDYNARRAYAMLFAPKGARGMSIGDHEEYEGEARDRQVDARGFNNHGGPAL